MSPDDRDEELAVPGEGETPGEDEAGEHEAPPPATWAGRRLAGKEGQAPEEEDLRAGFTEEFDEIERELDEELAGLGETSDEPELDDDEDVEEDDEDEPRTGEDELPAGATVEAETLALADRAEAEEAALAGLRARAAKQQAVTGTTAPAAPESAGVPRAEGPPPVAVIDQPVADDDGEGKPRAKRLWARFLAASLVIVISMAAATAISLLAVLTHVAAGLSDNEALASTAAQLEQVDGGDPQTILIIGSDKRLNTKGDPGRSDTTILLRVDPDKQAIALLSIPRDLRVNIPGVGVDKFNAAYSAGGPDKTVRVVKQLTGLEINHVVNINFTGFADAVDAIGCVYIDVDQRYYIPPETGTAEIDIEAGYQRLCGLKALEYVRFRHDDNDLVRSARQQDFLREARQKLPPGELISEHTKLLDIFTKYTTSDITEAVPLLELLKTFLAVQSAPVREVHFPAQLGAVYVTANDAAIKEAVAQFLDTEGTPGALPAGQSPPSDQGGDNQGGDSGGSGGNHSGGGGSHKPDQNPAPDHFSGPAMDDSTQQGENFAHQISVKKKKDGDPMVDFPIYYPTRLVPGSIISNDTRAFPIDGPGDDVFHGYKMVVGVPGDAFGHGLLSEYYGVSGTDWVDAPILANPSETRTIDGKDYLLFYDGDRLRTVGWKTGNAAYWVNNSLLQSLEEGQLLSIATSMREYEPK